MKRSSWIFLEYLVLCFATCYFLSISQENILFVYGCIAFLFLLSYWVTTKTMMMESLTEADKVIFKLTKVPCVMTLWLISLAMGIGLCVLVDRTVTSAITHLVGAMIVPLLYFMSYGVGFGIHGREKK